MFRIAPEVSVLSSKSRSGINNSCLLKAKFHYASWFGAGSEQVRRTGSEPAPNYIRTSSEQASVMEFVFYTRYSKLVQLGFSSPVYSQIPLR